MESNETLIKHLKNQGYLYSPSVIKAFESVDRADFVPRDLKMDAYADHPLPIGQGQTISQPAVVAFTLELASLKRGQRVLEVGAGSGWQAALMAHIVGEKGKVIAIERIAALRENAESNIGKYLYLKERLDLVLGDGSKGYAKEAPYDRIVAAASAPKVPEAWKEQLKKNAMIVAPVGQSIVRLTRISKGKFQEEKYPGFLFVPLIED